MTETIRYARIGEEDINFGTSTFEARLADGRVVLLSQVDLGVLLSDATISTRTVTLDTLTVTTLTATTTTPGTTFRIPEKADPGSPLSGEVWINSGGLVPEYADDAATPTRHAFVGDDTTQTLTNKTLTSPTISGPTFSGTAIGTYTLGGTPTLGAELAAGGNDITELDELAFTDAVANPTATGRIRRSGNELLWRQALGSMRLFYGEAGTIMLFQQTNAPTGWTKLTTHNDKAMRVVSGAASSGGADAFSAVFPQSTTASHTLTTAQLSSHSHIEQSFTTGGGTSGTAPGAFNATVSAGATTTASQSTGGGTGHTHNLTMDLQYVDLILASKD
jgi:hypothetical protein